MARYDAAAQTARYDRARVVARWDVRNRHPLTHHNRNHNNNQENTMSTRPSLTTTIAGFAARDAEVKFTQSGRAVAETTVPFTPRRLNRDTNQWEDAGDTTWVDVAVWGDDAETFANAVTKGTFLTVVGRPQVRAYTAKSGEARAALSVSADSWGITPRGQRQGGQPAQQQGGQWNAPQAGGAGDPWATQGGAPF